MLQCFRVYTEDIHRLNVLKAAQKRFPAGFSVFTGQGCWEGAQENCLVIEVIREAGDLPTVQRFAADIKRINKQDAVYITATALSFSEIV